MASTGHVGATSQADGSSSGGTGLEAHSQGGGNKEGWLEKKGDVNTNWRERWFSLSNGQLEYYVDKEVRGNWSEKVRVGNDPHTLTHVLSACAFVLAEIEEER